MCSSDLHLGGDDWDQRVIDWLVKEFKAKHGVDLGADKMAAQRLKEAAEKAKIELSQVQQTQINLPFITATAEGPLHLDETLSRAKFQEMTADLIERCRIPFEQALKDAGITKGELHHVILVGGSTRMPAVSDLVRELTGKDPDKGVNPDEEAGITILRRAPSTLDMNSRPEWIRSGFVSTLRRGDKNPRPDLLALSRRKPDRQAGKLVGPAFLPLLASKPPLHYKPARAPCFRHPWRRAALFSFIKDTDNGRDQKARGHGAQRDRQGGRPQRSP